MADAELLHLDFEFHAAYAAMDAAANRVEEFESQGLKKQMRAAERELEKLTQATDAIARKILATPRQHTGGDDRQAAGERHLARDIRGTNSSHPSSTTSGR